MGRLHLVCTQANDDGKAVACYATSFLVFSKDNNVVGVSGFATTKSDVDRIEVVLSTRAFIGGNLEKLYETDSTFEYQSLYWSSTLAFEPSAESSIARARRGVIARTICLFLNFAGVEGLGCHLLRLCYLRENNQEASIA